MAVGLNEELYDKTVDRAVMIARYEQMLKNKVFVIVDDHTVRLDKLISSAKTSNAGYAALREAVDQELQRAYKQVYNVSKRSLLEMVHDQMSYTFQVMDAGLSKVWRTKPASRQIGEDIVLKRPLADDQTLAEGWARVSNSERQRIERIIRKGIADGLTAAELSKEIRKGRIHKITKQHADALVTTAVTSVQAQADQAVYAANEPALEGWQYVAILDSSTTPLCRFRHGQVYPTGDVKHLPPAHFRCRSTTTPIVKRWDKLFELDNVMQIRKRNLQKLTPAQREYYDGLVPNQLRYDDWLRRQPLAIQLKHAGSQEALDAFHKGAITGSQLLNMQGKPIGIKALRQLTDSEFSVQGDTARFARAKLELDMLKLPVARPEDLLNDPKMQARLKEYYRLQSMELDGTLSLTNYRGITLGNKRATKRRVLTRPPTEEQMRFNPVTGRYEDVRLYQPAPQVLENNLRLVEEATELTKADKEFIQKFIKDMDQRIGVNELAVIADNLRIIFTRYRKNPEPWGNFKAVLQNQIKFDVMNVSDSIETVLRRDTDLLKKLKQANYIDPVLGATQLEELGDTFLDNIRRKNRWEDRVAPKLAKEMMPLFDSAIPLKIKRRISDKELNFFYERFARRLALADTPDVDQLAIALGRDLYNAANYTGSRQEWHRVGMKILQSKNVSKLYELETFGVQKRRMKSRMSGAYFGPYFDTIGYNVRIVDPRIQEYSKLTRKVEVGLRVAVTDPSRRLYFRTGRKTYFIKNKWGLYEDTRIPITSTSSFSEFPEEFIDKNLVDALNWAGQAEYRIDKDFYDFVDKLLNFEDDRGKAKYYNSLNEYRKYIASRGDSYERFKSMEWLRKTDRKFSNTPFIDHRARIYDRGFISPQSGETFRPFLNTAEEYAFSRKDFLNFQDQIGAFLGGLSEKLEGNFNSLTITGRQKIAQKYRNEMVKIGNQMRRAKPRDIRDILDNELVQMIDAEEQGKFFRFAIELAKMDEFLGGDYSKRSLERLSKYKTALALEQDASSSGAQIIALTTRNKQLAELSNVVPTNQKRRLYDEIAAATFNDPRFRELNKRLGLTEIDLRKAAKA